MDILILKDEVVELIEGAEALPQVKKFRTGIMQREKFFRDSLKYLYYMYSRKSTFSQMLPEDRKKKIFETFFPSEVKDKFDASKAFITFKDWYFEFSKSYKEKMYENHLADIEEMAVNISKIKFIKKKKIIREIQVKCPKKGDYVKVDIDTEIEIDNTQEKLNAMDLMTRLIEKEEFLKKKIHEEYIKESKKQKQRRLFDK